MKDFMDFATGLDVPYIKRTSLFRLKELDLSKHEQEIVGDTCISIAMEVLSQYHEWLQHAKESHS